MVRRAELDHYALFNCYQHLQTHKTCNVLISLMLRETILLLPNAESRQVLFTIKDALRRGVTKWPALNRVTIR